MLTLIALSAALMQQTPPPAAPHAPPEVRTRVMVVAGDGPGGLDKDGDGQVSREEFAAPMNDHFARMDADGDGRLSTGEMASGHGLIGEGGDHEIRILRGPGGHGGGDGPGVHRFELRRDHPGREPGDHASQREERTMVFVGGEPGAGGGREVFVLGGPGGHAAMAGAEWDGGPGERIEIRRMGGPHGEDNLDADGDGRISEAEFSAPLREAFARMDADRSGFIEEGERGAGRSEVFVHRFETRSDSED